jgi:uncharacterized membrane protein
MAYCANCGSQVDGRFCAKCGAEVGQPGGAVPPPPRPPGAAGVGMEENVAAALAYIPIVGLIFLLIEPYNKNKTIRFHSFQSIFYCIAWFVVSFALGILFVAMPYGMYWFGRMISSLANLALFAGWVLMAVKAFQKDRFVMPIIGPIAEKQA